MARLELTLPATWASYIVNNDRTGMTDNDIADFACVRSAIADVLGFNWTAIAKEEEFFTRNHDARQLIGGAVCCDYIFLA